MISVWLASLADYLSQPATYMGSLNGSTSTLQSRERNKGNGMSQDKSMHASIVLLEILNVCCNFSKECEIQPQYSVVRLGIFSIVSNMVYLIKCEICLQCLLYLVPCCDCLHLIMCTYFKLLRVLLLSITAGLVHFHLVSGELPQTQSIRYLQSTSERRYKGQIGCDQLGCDQLVTNLSFIRRLHCSETKTGTAGSFEACALSRNAKQVLT